MKRLLYILLLLGLGSISATAQMSPAKVQMKDPSKARTLAIFIPGSGHIYAGEKGKGFTLMLGSALGVGVALSNFETNYAYSCINGCYDPDAYDPDYTPLIIGGGVAAGLWLYSLIDAPKAVERANRRVGLTSNVEVKTIPVISGNQIRPSFSMRVTY